MADEKRTNLNAKMALGLAAPHTWAASITPVLLAGAIVFRETGGLRLPLFFILLIVCVLMQSAVNTINDYFDLVRGADSADDAVEESDAVLIYNNVPPRQALYLGFGFLLAAGALAIYPVIAGGWSVLIVGLIGAAVVLLYSAGPLPLSHLPLSELISGFVMGSLIPLGCHNALTGTLRLSVMIDTAPVAFAIAMIMLTNNTCDVEKDRAVGRKTLAALLGRKRAVMLYRLMMIVWVVLMGVYVAFFWSRSFAFPAAILTAAGLATFFFGIRLTLQQTRQIADASRRPLLMKRVSLTTLIYGLSLVFVVCAAELAAGTYF